MRKEDIVNQVKEEFEGMGLVTSDSVVRRMVERAINYWNVWSAYPKSTMIDNTKGSSGMIDLSNTDIDRLIYVFPSEIESMPFAITPVWSLFGFDVLDRMLEEVAVLWYYIKGLRIYLGKDFRWRWEKPYFMFDDCPAVCNKFLLYYYKYIRENENIEDPSITDWLIRYVKALVYIEEGRRIRKAKLIGVDIDGNELIAEGKEERDRLEKELRDRAIVFPSRF